MEEEEEKEEEEEEEKEEQEEEEKELRAEAEEKQEEDGEGEWKGDGMQQLGLRQTQQMDSAEVRRSDCCGAEPRWIRCIPDTCSILGNWQRCNSRSGSRRGNACIGRHCGSNDSGR